MRELCADPHSLLLTITSCSTLLLTLKKPDVLRSLKLVLGISVGQKIGMAPKPEAVMSVVFLIAVLNKESRSFTGYWTKLEPFLPERFFFEVQKCFKQNLIKCRYHSLETVFKFEKIRKVMLIFMFEDFLNYLDGILKTFLAFLCPVVIFHMTFFSR